MECLDTNDDPHQIFFNMLQYLNIFLLTKN